MKAKLLMSMRTRAVRVPAYELILATDRQYKKWGLKIGSLRQFDVTSPIHGILRRNTRGAIGNIARRCSPCVHCCVCTISHSATCACASLT
jgi:hypothetical protein